MDRPNSTRATWITLGIVGGLIAGCGKSGSKGGGRPPDRSPT